MGTGLQQFQANLLDAELEGQIQYEADLAANREEDMDIPECIEHFFVVDEGQVALDDMLLKEAVADEGNVHEPEQGQDEFEDERRVQVIVDGVAMVWEAVEAVGDDAVPGPDAQQQL